jgi:rod shape determining protein RodA
MLRRWLLPLLILTLSLLSVITLRSIAPQLVGRQVLFFIIGGVIFLLTSRIHASFWQNISGYLYAGLVGMLVLTQAFGTVTRGTRSWIPVGSFHIQPSQLAIACGCLFLAFWVAKKPLHTLANLVVFSVIAMIPAALIMTEPDLGSAVIYLAGVGTLFFLAKTKISYILTSVTLAVVISLLAWTFFLKPYQKDRITSFMNGTSIESDASYNATQSVIAVGSGQYLGRGIGQGVQSHLRFLPERQTDFIFASFAEELGLLGTIPVIFLYAMLVLFIFFAGSQFKDPAIQYFYFLTAVVFTVQIGINIGMNMGLLPITGITLPFLSYGGSSILSLCFHLGIIQSFLRSYQKREVLHLK